jgi:hypothetical protein
MKRLHRACAAVALLMTVGSLVAPSSGAATSTGSVTVRAWLLTRTTSHANSYQALVGWRQDADHPGWAASVELFAHRTTGFAGLIDSTENLVPTAYLPSATIGCGGQPSGACYSPFRALAFYEAFGKFGSGASAPTSVLVVASGITPNLSFSGSGWRASSYTHRIQRAVAATSGAAGLELGEYGTVEVDGISTVKGGSRGSVAIAQPSCQNLSAQPVAVGLGTASLHGGTGTPTLACPTANSPSILSALATKGTTWRLNEPIAGYASGPTRLVVIDL